MVPSVPWPPFGRQTSNRFGTRVAASRRLHPSVTENCSLREEVPEIESSGLKKMSQTRLCRTMPFAGKQSQSLLGFHTPPHKSYLRAITLRGLEILWQAVWLSRARTAHNQTTERKIRIPHAGDMPLPRRSLDCCNASLSNLKLLGDGKSVMGTDGQIARLDR
jgi:hypothetical protein